MRRGFTLVELVVVIVIAGLLTTASAVTIFSVKQKRQTKAVAKQIKNVILEAHAYAISSKTLAPTGTVDIILVDPHTIKANVGTSFSVISPVKVSSKVTLTCTDGANTKGDGAVCFSFSNVVDKIGQTTDAIPHYITAVGPNNERYTTKVGHLSGNVTITTP